MPPGSSRTHGGGKTGRKGMAQRLQVLCARSGSRVRNFPPHGGLRKPRVLVDLWSAGAGHCVFVEASDFAGAPRSVKMGTIASPWRYE